LRVRKTFLAFMPMPPFWCAVHGLRTRNVGRAGAHPYRATSHHPPAGHWGQVKKT
jgi:hypothetical protein